MANRTPCRFWIVLGASGRRSHWLGLAGSGTPCWSWLTHPDEGAVQRCSVADVVVAEGRQDVVAQIPLIVVPGPLLDPGQAGYEVRRVVPKQDRGGLGFDDRVRCGRSPAVPADPPLGPVVPARFYRQLEGDGARLLVKGLRLPLAVPAATEAPLHPVGLRLPVLADAGLYPCHAASFSWPAAIPKEIRKIIGGP